MKIRLNEQQLKILIKETLTEVINEAAYDDFDDILAAALASDPKASAAMKAAMADSGVKPKRKKAKKATNEPENVNPEATDDDIIAATADDETEEDTEEEKELSAMNKVFAEAEKTLSEDDVERIKSSCSYPYGASYDDLVFTKNAIQKIFGVNEVSRLKPYNAVAKEIINRDNIMKEFKEFGTKPLYGYKIENGKVEPSHKNENMGSSILPGSMDTASYTSWQ